MGLSWSWRFGGLWFDERSFNLNNLVFEGSIWDVTKILTISGEYEIGQYVELDDDSKCYLNKLSRSPLVLV